MNINNIRTSIGYKQNATVNDLEIRKNSVREYRLSKANTTVHGDRINISEEGRRAPYSRGIGLSVDKGTAANTTLYVDRNSFDQIVNYTTNNPNCKWDELGVDDEKRWVVVNGQRFECPLSEEEKEAARRMREESNLVGVLDKHEKELAKYRKKSVKKFNQKQSVKISFDGKKQFKIDNASGVGANAKVSGLIKNEKVMKMLSDIAASNGGAMNLGL